MTHRILIVEDEAIVALDLRIQLQDLGYPVVGVAATAARALELARTARPDVVLMDVRIDGPGDGIDAAEAIGSELGLPVIFLTAHSDFETVSRAVATAPYGFLTKPFQMPELRAAIEVAQARVGRERTSVGVQPATAGGGEQVQAQAREHEAQARARLSHEMRTPLNAVIGFAQLLQRDGEAAEAQRGEYVRHIETAGRHLLAMLDDALDSPRTAPALVVLDAAAQLRDVALSLCDAATAQRITLRCDNGTPVLVRADGPCLRRALMSLAGNALKFSRPGGEVGLQARVDPADPGQVVITISDRGIGMTPEQQDRLLQRSQAEAGDAGADGGFGFSVARGLVERMGGSLRLESAPRQGTQVQVRLEAA